jgi:hypothetical protein
MPIRKFAAAVALSVAAIGLTACATGLNTRVTRYSAAAIAPGQTFFIQPAQGVAPSLEFNRYGAMVAQQLEARGFRPAVSPQAADMVVRVGYGIDEGTTEYVDDRPMGWGPGYGGFGGYGPYRFGWRDPFYDPFWGSYGRRPFYSRWGGGPFYYGWDDPFWYASGSPYGYGGVREYTVYKSRLDMDIVRKADNAPLFEGHAQARSQTDNSDVLVPDLITAMFTGFPGRNGETVKITVPPVRR